MYFSICIATDNLGKFVALITCVTGRSVVGEDPMVLKLAQSMLHVFVEVDSAWE